MPIVSALEGTQAYEFGTELGIQPTEIDWVENMTPYTSTGPFERNDCQVLVTHLIENHNITGTEKELFAVNETTKQYLNSPTDMTLTLVGCKALCGPQTFYVDAGPRFMIWILPGTYFRLRWSGLAGTGRC